MLFTHSGMAIKCIYFGIIFFLMPSNFFVLSDIQNILNVSQTSEPNNKKQMGTPQKINETIVLYHCIPFISVSNMTIQLLLQFSKYIQKI